MINLGIFLIAQTPVDSGVSSVEELSFGWLLVKTLLAMVLVLVCAVAFIKYIMPKLQRNSMSGGSSQIRLLDKFSLEMRKSLCLIEVGKRYFLISNTEQGINLISELKAEDIEGEDQ